MKSSAPSVLIVDDIAYVRKTMKQILTSHGFRVVGEAHNGEEAVRLYAECRPDIVTMDLVMPVLNGVDATKLILKNDPDAKIFILSSMTQENLVTEAILAGAKNYIIKPFQTDEVVRTIRETLAGNTNVLSFGSVAS